MSETRRHFRSFEEFWPYYLGEHRRPMCRALHYLGTLGAIAVAVWAVLTGMWLGLALAIVVGYGFAWVGHLFIEHNHPATWGYVGYSFIADIKMIGLALTGRIKQELERASGDSES